MKYIYLNFFDNFNELLQLNIKLISNFYLYLIIFIANIKILCMQLHL